MKKIKANIAENRYRFFTIIDELPQVGDVIEKNQYEVLAINEVRLDPEQPNSEVYDYKYYEIVKKDLFDADVEEETITYDYVCVKWNDPVQDMFELHAEKYGTVFCDDVEIALIENPYPEGSIYDWYFRASGMDKDGNLWDIYWDVISGADSNTNYDEEIVEWDKPVCASLIVEGFFLDD